MIDIRFTRGAATIRSGATATLVLPLAPARSTVVQLVDEALHPLSGMNVTAWVFGSTSNHCGSLVATDSLGTTTSDGAGRIELPSGDFEHTLVLGDDAYVFASRRSESYARGRLIQRLDGDTTRILLYHLPVVRLELVVTERGSPVQGLTLRAKLADCGCGACDGPLETTDARGRILIEQFRPDEWSEVELRDGEGRVRWSGTPLDWSGGGTFEVRVDTRVPLVRPREPASG